jgi:DNA ligase-1
MKRFAALYDALDATTRTGDKVAALEAYFREAPPGDAAWALFFLTGNRLLRVLPSRLVVAWTLELAAIPEWLLEESYAAVGDLAETVALLLDRGRDSSQERSLASFVEERIRPLRDLAPEEQRARVLEDWSTLDRRELYLYVKLMTGELRVGVSAKLVARALAKVAGTSEPEIAHRLMGTWEPGAAFFEALIRGGSPGAPSRPYPFALASPLEAEPAALGPRDEWQVEWKWDGIRSQLLRRAGETWIWSRGEELVTERFPDITGALALPEGTVLDGEILAWRDGKPLAFGALQRRIGRKKLTPKILGEVPVVFMAYDLLEESGLDVRALPLAERRARLERFPGLLLSPVLEGTWEELARLREESRARAVEGFMLKRKTSAYGSGRKRGDWWKWKIDPYTIDAVLIHAQPGHGRRASVFTDYTFGVWEGDRLLPIAKAYTGLSDEEIDALDAWIRAHTLEKHGPVRVVEPSHVFELAFEGIGLSPRHKSGIAVRFPRIKRWRTDKLPRDADTLAAVRALLKEGDGGVTPG